MRAEITYGVNVYDDDGNLILNIPPVSEVIEKDGIVEKRNDTIKIPGSTTDLEYILAPVNNADMLLIVSDQPISFKKNADDGEVQNISADNVSESKKKGVLLWTTSGVTSLFFSNAGSETANVTIVALAT